jgi:dCMP deaminase
MTEILSWQDTFIYMAKLISLRSKDPRTKVGACIVDSMNRVIGLGYNGMPRGCDAFSWNRRPDSPLDDKHMYVVHAEHNAILNSNRHDFSGCKLFVTLHPCNECAKHIIQAGIREVYYLSAEEPGRQEYLMNKPEIEGARRLFAAAGIVCKPALPERERLHLKIVSHPLPVDQSATYCGAHC